jgi:hypothetical protein
LGCKRVVGIDIQPNEGEQFEHYQIDLTDPYALHFLPSESFHLVTNIGFCPPKGSLIQDASPTLSRDLSYRHYEELTKDPEALAKVNIIELVLEKVLEEIGMLSEVMRAEACRLLRKPGLYVLENDGIIK